MLRKKTIQFFLFYFIIMIALFTVFFRINDTLSKQLSVTQDKLHGVNYLHHLYQTNINLANIMYKHVDLDKKEYFKEEILKNIQAIFTLQKQNPLFKNKTLNQKLNSLKKFNFPNEQYYEFID